ncbi:hypothetical protein [Spiroplasma endosymbiont of Stenodema calcarata]|uniref:hypothetical protein n=1 Tax=Spiroplasma endosymbiont of Stenodema calcarata TaxID=3139328 RepID=UPI003CCAFFA8
MKQLLSLLGICTLKTTSATALVSCKTQLKINEDTNDEQTVKDIDNLLKIANMAKKALNEGLFRSNIDSKDVRGLDKIYQIVTKLDEPYVLNKTKDGSIINYFDTVLNVIFANINHKIIQDYSNYYYDSLPLSYEKNDVEYTINWVDKNDLNFSNFNVVSVDLKLKFKVQFKNYIQDEIYSVIFNVTNNLTKLDEVITDVSKIILPVFKNYANQYKNVNLGQDKSEKGFSELYDEFNIMYGKNYQQVEDTFKNSFQNYVLKSTINKYHISFNNQNLFLDQTSSAFLPSYDHKQIHPNFSETFKLISHWTIFDIDMNELTNKKPKLSFKAQSERYQARMNEQYKKFVDEFYELHWENDILNLATFSFNWNFVKLSGLALARDFSESVGADLGTAININRKFFNNKLQNFINIIVEFYKSVDMQLVWYAQTTWFLKENVFTKYLNDPKSFSFNNFAKSNFKNTSIGEKLSDINLLNF